MICSSLVMKLLWLGCESLAMSPVVLAPDVICYSTHITSWLEQCTDENRDPRWKGALTRHRHFVHGIYISLSEMDFWDLTPFRGRPKYGTQFLYAA